MDGEERIETSPWRGQVEGTGVSMDQGSSGEQFRARIKELKRQHKTLPAQYRGYEALMDTFNDPAVNIPQGWYLAKKINYCALQNFFFLFLSQICMAVLEHLNTH